MVRKLFLPLVYKLNSYDRIINSIRSNNTCFKCSVYNMAINRRIMKELYPRGTKIKLPKTKLGEVHKCNIVRDAIHIGQDFVYYGGISKDGLNHKIAKKERNFNV